MPCTRLNGLELGRLPDLWGISGSWPWGSELRGFFSPTPLVFLEVMIWGFPKLRGYPFLGVPITRILVYGGLYYGEPSIWEATV